MAALGAAAGGYESVARDWRTGAPIISIYDTNRFVPGGAEFLTRGLGTADTPTLFRACVESNFDTRMALVLPTTMIAEEMREAVEKAHLRNFPEHGRVACSKLMIMAHGYWYTFSHGPLGATVQGTDARFKIELVSERGVFPRDNPQQHENIDQRSRLPEEPQKKELVLEKGQQGNDQRSRFPKEPQKKVLVLEKGQQENVDERFRHPEEPHKKELVVEKGQQENIHQRSQDPQEELVLEKGEEPQHQEHINRLAQTSVAGTRSRAIEHDIIDPVRSLENDKELTTASAVVSRPTSKEESLNQKEMSTNEETGRFVSTELSAHPVAGEEVKMITEQAKEKTGAEAETGTSEEASGADAMLAMLVKPYETRKGKSPAIVLSGQGVKENEATGKTGTSEKQNASSEIKKGNAPEVEQGIKENIMPDAAGKTSSGADTVLEKPSETIKRKAPEVHVDKVKKLKVDISDHMDGNTVQEVECEIGVTKAREGIPKEMETKEKSTVNSVNHGSVGEEKAVKTNGTRSTNEKESDSTTNSGASTGAMDSEINKNLDDIMANLMTQHFPPASPSMDRNPIPSSTAFGSGESDSESSNDRDDYDEVVKKAGDAGNMKTSEASIEKTAKKDSTEAEMPQERSGEVAKDESKAQKKKLLPTNSGSTAQESDSSIKNSAAPQSGKNPSEGSSAESSEESSSADESESTVSEKWKKTASTVPRSRRNSTAVAPTSVPVRRNPRRNSIDSRFERFIENKNGLEELLNLRMQKRVPSPADVANDSPSVDVVLETQEIQGGNTVCKQVGSSEQGSEGKSDREEPELAKKSKGGEQDKHRVENTVSNDKENDLEAKSSIFKECAERYQKIVTKEKQVKEIASTENEKPDKSGKKSRVKRIATRDMIQASTETSDYASSEDESRKRRKKSGGSSKSKSSKSAQSNSNLETKATRSEIKKAEIMKETSDYVGSEDSDSSRKRRKKSGGSSKSKSSKPAQSNSNLEPKATRSDTKKAETMKATPSTGKPAKVSGGEISCPGCGKVYARKTSAFYSHKKACTGNL